MVNAQWVATISDGTVATQDMGEWIVIKGERLPWFRLCRKLEAEGLHITSLRLNIDGQTIHLPRENNKFPSIEPDYYSVCYRAEVTIGGSRDEERFVDISAHFGEYEVHYIHSLINNNSWVTVTKGESVSPSPKKKLTTNN